MSFTFNSESITKINVSFRCAVCGKRYKTQPWFNKHQQEHNNLIREHKTRRRAATLAIRSEKKRQNELMKKRQRMINLQI